MTVEQGLYPPGSKVRFLRAGLPFIGRVLEDDPENGRAKIRIETQPRLMQAYAMTTCWVHYDRITGRI